MEEIEFLLDSVKEIMQNAILHLEKEFNNIRAGKASPVMVKGIKVDYYGSLTPLDQVANINTLDARTISIQPWEKQTLQPIEKAILEANIGVTPMNNGDIIMINIPPLTEERRKELVKQVKQEAEKTKISIRNARQEANKELKGLGLAEDILKNAEIDVQGITDSFIKKIDELFTHKEKEILEI